MPPQDWAFFFRSVGAAALVVRQNLSPVPRTDYVFLVEIGDGHYQGMNRLWGKVIKKAALSEVTPHNIAAYDRLDRDLLRRGDSADRRDPWTCKSRIDRDLSPPAA